MPPKRKTTTVDEESNNVNENVKIQTDNTQSSELLAVKASDTSANSDGEKKIETPGTEKTTTEGQNKREKKKTNKRESKKTNTSRASKKQRRGQDTTHGSDEEDSDDDQEEEEEEEDYGIGNNNQDNDITTWSTPHILQFWTNNPPAGSFSPPCVTHSAPVSDAFPAASQGNSFLGSTYGQGQWKWREVGTQVWYAYDDYINAIFEYNYKRGCRSFKVTQDGTEYQVSLDLRSQRESANHNNRWVINRF